MNQEYIRVETPHADELLTASLKWLRRLVERKDNLHSSTFFDGCDPAPLVKKIEQYLSQP